jgi:hypothetical protein
MPARIRPHRGLVLFLSVLLAASAVGCKKDKTRSGAVESQAEATASTTVSAWAGTLKWEHEATAKLNEETYRASVEYRDVAPVSTGEPGYRADVTVDYTRTWVHNCYAGGQTRIEEKQNYTGPYPLPGPYSGDDPNQKAQREGAALVLDTRPEGIWFDTQPMFLELHATSSCPNEAPGESTAIAVSNDLLDSPSQLRGDSDPDPDHLVGTTVWTLADPPEKTLGDWVSWSFRVTYDLRRQVVDTDGDGIPDTIEGGPGVDTDRDGTPDYRDLDSDNDGIPDSAEGADDGDGDGIPDFRDLDSDNDGTPDSADSDAGGGDSQNGQDGRRPTITASDTVIDVDYDFGTDAPSPSVAPLRYASGDGLRLDTISAPSPGGTTTGSPTGDEFIFIPPSAAFVGPVQIDYTVRDAAGRTATATITLAYRGCKDHSAELMTANLGAQDNNASRIAPRFRVCTDFQSQPEVRGLDVATESYDGIDPGVMALNLAVSTATRGLGGFEVTRDYAADPAPDGSFLYRRQVVCDRWTLNPAGAGASAALRTIIDNRVAQAAAGKAANEIMAELVDIGQSVACNEAVALSGVVSGDQDGYTVAFNSHHESEGPKALLHIDRLGPFDVSAGDFVTTYHCPILPHATEFQSAEISACAVSGSTRHP